MKTPRDGVLIPDEVKVGCQLIWNSHSQKLLGLCMTRQDLSSMMFTKYYSTHSKHPTYSIFMEIFDLQLRHYWTILTCSESIGEKAILVCVMKVFHSDGRKTSLLVCNGCPANVTTIKTTHRCSGVDSTFSVD